MYYQYYEFPSILIYKNNTFILTALLVAGRMHNFSRHLKEMIKVVRVSETTIRKR